MNKIIVSSAVILINTALMVFADSIRPLADYKLNRFQVTADSGDVACYDDQIHQGHGSKLYLTVLGQGTLTFQWSGVWGYYNCYCDDWSSKVKEYQGLHGDHYYEDATVNIQGEGLHTIVWIPYTKFGTT